MPASRSPPRPRDRTPSAAEREARRSRALEEPLDVRLRSSDPFDLLEVRNPLHGTVYLVMLPEFPERASELCTCTDFARRGLGTCKHLEAAYRWRTEHPGAEADAPPRATGASTAAVWKEIDRRRAHPGLGPESLRVRRPGSVLYERSRARAETD